MKNKGISYNLVKVMYNLYKNIEIISDNGRWGGKTEVIKPGVK
jgi:hypothetical protein